MFPRINGAPMIPAAQVQQAARIPDYIQRQLDFWCQGPHAPERRELAAQWSAIHHEEAASRDAPPMPDSRVIFRLLQRVSETGGLDGLTAGQRDNAVALLKATASDATFRAACAAQARLALEDCHDNALVQFEAVCRELPFQHARTTQDFLQAARGKAVSDLLQGFVGERFPGHNEALEIFQYLMVELGPALGLPESRMQYARFALHCLGDRVDQVVDEALQHVERNLGNERIAKVLLDVPLWETHVKERFRTALDACFQPLLDRVDAIVFGEAADLSAQGGERRIAALGNIQHNEEAPALQRLTVMCVEEAGRSAADVDVEARVRERLGLTARVEARLPNDAGFRAIAARAAAQAAQWSQPTEVLAGHQWGRLREGDVDDPARADPMREHFRQQQARPRPPAATPPVQAATPRAQVPDAPTPVAVAQPGVVTQMRRDPEVVALQRALEESMHSLRGAAQDRVQVPQQQAPVSTDADRARRLDVRQAIETLRGDRGIATPGVDRAALAFGEVQRLSSATRVPDPPYMVEPTRLRDLLKQSEAVAGSDAQRALALHGDAALLDLMRARVKSDPGSANAMLAALSGRDAPGTRTPLQILGRLVASPATDPDVQVAQARLSTSTAYLLRRLAVSIAQVQGMDESGGRARVRDAMSGDGSLFPAPPTRTSANALGVLALRLEAFGLDPLRPHHGRPQLAQLEAATDIAIGRIADATLRRAYSPTLNMHEAGERLADVLLEHARRASAHRR